MLSSCETATFRYVENASAKSEPEKSQIEVNTPASANKSDKNIEKPHAPDAHAHDAPDNITSEKTPDKNITMAVLYFDNNSITNVKELEPFKKGLTDSLISELSRLENIQIVERTRLENVLAELKLSSSGLVDDNSAKKIGNILGVKYILLGSFVSIGNVLRIDARIIDMSCGVISKSVSVDGKSEDFFELIDALTEKIGKGLSLSLKKPNNEPPKINFDALLYYSEGLDSMDKKDYSGAENKFNMALKLQPDYKDAAEKLNEIKSKLNEKN